MATTTLAGGFTYFEGLSITPYHRTLVRYSAITILGAGFDETTTALIGNVPLEQYLS